ncbi:hypothetical protein AVEN_270216-1 [Araneus ventricosus]|uniref:Tc1-like transposase DDE domain-containing protein n=1 Tax=Araneus ventricosus TaxID=182803 RepID=A0A4Y2G0D2_ARAVE|nr:hypothetical protein AVEN_270216-1 [Araneus ventricosus]
MGRCVISKLAFALGLTLLRPSLWTLNPTAVIHHFLFDFSATDPRSPDLNLLNFYLRRYLKTLITPDIDLVTTIADAAACVRCTPAGFEQVGESMSPRCEACIVAAWMPSGIIFMQDDAPRHIDRRVKKLLRQHFIDAPVISRNFPTAWPPRSPEITPCDFWLWSFLKNNIYRKRPASLPDL